MEINQLRYFCAIARAGSFTRAAEQLGIAQPSLSQQIKKLERKLGCPLFERLGRSVRLTPAGQELHAQAVGILEQVSEAESRVADLQRSGRGQLRVGAIPTIMPYFLARRIGDFLKRFPNIELHLMEATTSRLTEALQAGEIDLAVASLPVRSVDLVCSELFREELLLAVPAKHRFCQQPAIHLKEIERERFLLLKEGHCLRSDVLTACTQAKTELHSVFETDQMESIFQLVRSGFGLSLVPEMAWSSAAGCSLVPLESKHYRRIGYLRARRHYVSQPMRAFTSWLRATVKPVKPAA